MKIVCPNCLSINNVPVKDEYKKANCGKCKKSLLEAKIIDANPSNIDKIIENSEIPLCIDFWAPWCGPCKMFAPVFTQGAKLFALKAQFVKVNTEAEQSLGSRFQIRSIPTLAVFKGGKEVERMSGALDIRSLENFVKKFL